MNLHVLAGPNFSGRSARLRKWVGLPDDPAIDPVPSRNAYIGPDGTSGLSGIAPTVAGEIDLMAKDRAAATAGRRAMELLGFGYCLAQNPFTLSGGEQVITAIVAAAAGRPERLAIDCAFEQLDDDTRDKVLQYLEDLDGDLMVADNRLDEWFTGRAEQVTSVLDAPRVQATHINDPEWKSAQIDIVDLCYSYVKTRPVLTDLNITLEAGKRYLLRGPNGCGKTTLSKLLCGLLKPTSGEIRVNDRPVQPWLTPGRFVGYHFQNPDYQLFANCVGAQFRSPRAMKLAQHFGLHGLLEDHPLDLPYVLRKRVAIASTLGQEAGAVFLDEPSIGQDASFVSSLVESRFKSTCVVISHSRRFDSLPKVSLSATCQR